MNKDIVTSIKVSLWPDCDIVWNNIFPDVNILVGINGSGKTTLLNALAKELHEDDGNTIVIQSIDNTLVRDKRRSDNALLQELNHFIYDLKTTSSLFLYRMRQLDVPEQASIINNRIKNLLLEANGLFANSKKELRIANNRLEVCLQNKKVIDIDLLSSGEKWLLLVLLRVFLTEEKPVKILIDEPEASLHISWQQELVNVLVRINPNAQFFITTHSPSIFAKGWQDRIVFIDSLKQSEGDE